MKKGVFAIAAIMSCIQLFSQTVIPAGDVSGIWQYSGSPYLVEGDITIQDQQTLIIEPGCLINFQGYYEINVQGRILAEGTQQDSIYFFRANISWSGINFIQTSASNDSSKFFYCKITNTSDGAIEIDSFDKIIITNSKIENNSRVDNGGGINCLNSEIYIKDSYITRNSSYSNDDESTCGGSIYLENSSLKLENCIISRSSVRGEYELSGGAGAGIYITNSSCDITNCEIFGNYSIINGGPSYGGGLFAYNSLLDIHNTIFRDNEMTVGSGLYTHDTNGVIINSLVHNNNSDGGFMDGEGIGISNSSFDIINTIVCNNSAYGMIGSGNINIINSIFTNNTYEQIHLSGGFQGCYTTVNVLYSAIEDGINGIEIGNPNYITLNWLEGNIGEDPLFIDPESWNYHFVSNSPCINTGTPDTLGLNLPEYDLDGNPRIYEDRIDMGCYEWQGTGTENIEVLLKQNLYNYPNPFNPTTTINYTLKENSKVSLNIYNIKGQKVKTLVDEMLPAGQHSVIWNGDDEYGKPVSSGIYYYKLNVNGKTEAVKKCMLLK